MINVHFNPMDGIIYPEIQDFICTRRKLLRNDILNSELPTNIFECCSTIIYLIFGYNWFLCKGKVLNNKQEE
ncbi:hypothetical protein D9M68_513270 [compost metagenome]